MDPAELIDALVAEARTRLDEAVDAGRLDESEAAEKLADLEQRITDMVNGDLPLRGPGFGPGRHGGMRGGLPEGSGS